ncbi:MAG: 50S ribosome-binding GTPase [Chromatiaceae bacterium]|nr:50S ribosome-binding GTPase [Chromatiaceae bacterium]
MSECPPSSPPPESRKHIQWSRWRDALLNPRLDPVALEQALSEARARAPLPVIWLLGKTQSGKTSIVRALTNSDAAEIGNGFQPCTATARLYDFPPETPLVRFLDTRGLGELDYDPAEDMRVGESQAHLLLAVMKAADTRQDALLEVLREVRRRHPDWPLVIAQTGLHELYALDEDHPQPWPFDRRPWPASVGPNLTRALEAQRQRLGALPGSAPVRWVPIDLTLPEDGFNPPDYGLEALWEAIDAVSTQRLGRLLRADPEVRDLLARAAHPHILGHALSAAGLGALPVVDLVAVPALQAKLLHSLATLYEQPWDRRLMSDFLGLLGSGIGVSYAAHAAGRSLMKLVPGWGQTLGALWGASASGAATYALGKAAAFHFSNRRQGLVTDERRLRQIFSEQFERGRLLIRQRGGRP